MSYKRTDPVVRNRWENTQYSAWQTGYMQAESSINYGNPYCRATEPDLWDDWHSGARQAGLDARPLLPAEAAHQRSRRNAQGFGYYLRA